MEYDSKNLKDVRTRSDIVLKYYQEHPEKMTIKNALYFSDWFNTNGQTSFSNQLDLRDLITASINKRLEHLGSGKLEGDSK